MEIPQRGDHVEINYEFMDVHRSVPLHGTLADAPPTVPDWPHMGRSLGRYEGEELVVDTIDAEPGYLDTARTTINGSRKPRANSARRFRLNVR
jgi:hypothetical protein